MARYRIFFTMCREGQKHDNFLFATPFHHIAHAWASMEGFTVFDAQDNYSHVIGDI